MLADISFKTVFSARYCLFHMVCFYKPKTWLTRSLYHFLYSVRKSSGTLDPILLVKQWLESWDLWNYSHRFSQGCKDKFITMRSVKHGGKSWFKRQGWSQWLYDNVNHRPSNPCETIKPFPLEKCGTSNVKIILILLHVSIKPRYFFNSRVVHIIKENILTSSIRCLQLGMSCRGIQLIKKLHELIR